MPKLSYNSQSKWLHSKVTKVMNNFGNKMIFSVLQFSSTTQHGLQLMNKIGTYINKHKAKRFNKSTVVETSGQRCVVIKRNAKAWVNRYKLSTL